MDSWGTPVPPVPPVRQPSYRGQIVKREPSFHRAAPIAATLVGYSGGLYSLLCGGGWLLDRLLGYASWSGFPWLLFYAAWALGFFMIGTIGAVQLNGKNKMRRIWQYLKGRDFCKISEVASRLKMSEKKAVQTIEKMIGKKLLPEGHLDETKTCLMLTDETYARYLESQKSAQKAAQEQEARRKEAEEHPERAAMAEMVQEGSRYIQRIREINNDLPDPVVSAKLDDLEKVCQQIFAYVGDHPDKLPEIRKFMSYYLPTTLKLLEAYRKLAHQNTGTESEEKTEQEILAAVDNINLAFQNLLNELMEDDYLDLSSDISVLQSMLSQEGLVDDFSSSQSEKEKEADEKKREPDLSLDPFAELSRMESELSKDTPPEPELHL